MMQREKAACLFFFPLPNSALPPDLEHSQCCTEEVFKSAQNDDVAVHRVFACAKHLMQ